MIPELALARALPELRARELTLRGLAAAAGITYEIADFGGFRTQADTALILTYRTNDYAKYVSAARAAGKTPVSIDRFRPIAPYGQSFHDYGAAFDAHITSAPPGMTFAAALDALGKLGGKAGLLWGGLFANPDPPHFQLATGLTQAKEMWQQYTSGTTPTAPASSPDMAALLAASLPGVQVIAAKPTAVPIPMVAGAVKTVATKAVALAHRAPLATATIGTGALIAAGLFMWLAVRRYLDSD